MARVLVAVEDSHYGPLERALRRACRHIEPDFPDTSLKFNTVRGMGGFSKFASTDLPLARSRGVPSFGTIDSALCIMDADRAHEVLGLSSAPNTATASWHQGCQQAFTAKLTEWGAPPGFPLESRILRWNLESLFVAFFDRFADQEVLLALGVTTPAEKVARDLKKYLKACRPTSPLSVTDQEFCDKWQKPKKCLDGILSAVGGASLGSKSDTRRTALIGIATKGSGIESLFVRVPDIPETARALIKLVQGT
jgi:hypothetical protein